MDRVKGLTCSIPIQMCKKDVVSIVTFDLAPVVQKVDSTIHQINHYPLDSAIGFPNTYPLDGDLSGGYRYPAFEQLGPDRFTSHQSHYCCLYNNGIPEFMRKRLMLTVK